MPKKALHFVILSITSCFGLGFLPFIPGTFGSLAGLFLYYLLRYNTGIHLLVTILILLLGFFLSGVSERILNKKDARCIVIDEVGGMLISFLFLPYDIKFLIIGFFLFRLFDCLKPYPVGRLERLKGGIGVMSDDIIAGIYANIVLQLVFRLASFKIS
ncbi:MAG: phosphatidylglycerophosphatase A [Candidatus Omnitrophica bacterium]|nr:phosphatidylglycerophosphatase A [Candidatus Omnitrophota bacterium]MBU1869971.1 phosphatidylglycerophosphatase A [Candidatus Omnitrophota bacterium]